MIMVSKLFLEPHYGDIAWSCGGLVAKYKKESIIVTIFPPRRKFYRLKLKARKYRKKKREEVRFEKLYGVKIIYLKYKSAFMRGRILEDLFDKKLNDLEKEIVIQLREFITNLVLEEGITEIYCPMAQRNQIDHLIVKEAISNLLVENINIFYYEDFPNFLPESRKLVTESNLNAIRVDISEVIEDKIKAVLFYDSLIEPYFVSKEKLVDLIRKTPFEIFWQEKN
jgi:LmbE family N-acetylglucosaminyl deacetylase